LSGSDDVLTVEQCNTLFSIASDIDNLYKGEFENNTPELLAKCIGANPGEFRRQYENAPVGGAKGLLRARQQSTKLVLFEGESDSDRETVTFILDSKGHSLFNGQCLDDGYHDESKSSPEDLQNSPDTVAL